MNGISNPDNCRGRFSIRHRLAALIILTLILGSASPARAIEGDVFPATAGIGFDWQASFDTVHVSIWTQTPEPITSFYLADITIEPTTLLECRIDGVLVSDLVVESTPGVVIPGWYSTHFIATESFQSIQLKYYSRSYRAGNITWAAGKPFPVFGVTYYEILECCLGQRGNIDGDPTDRVDVADLVYFVKWTLDQPGGPAPPCLTEADVDGSGQIDVADLIYLVRWMFNTGGEPPVSCP